MRTHAALFAVVIALAISGGLAAFLLASPDQERRPAPMTLGFARLDQETLQAGVERAAEHHRAAHRMLIARRTAARAAKLWLESLPGSRATKHRPPRAMRLVPRDAVARTRLAQFARWADDLPRAQWTATAGMGTVVEDLDGSTDAASIDPDAYRVVGSVNVQLGQATQRIRRQRVPVVVDLLPLMRAGRDAPVGWQVLDVRAGQQDTFLRAYTDPFLVRRGSVDVIAPAGSAGFAQSIADDAGVQLANMSARYPNLSGVGIAAIWMVERGARAAQVLGSGPPAETVSASAGELHGTVWVDARGDIAVDLQRAAALPDGGTRSAVRHALAHLATRDISGKAPALFSEGIAMYEARRAGGGSVLAGIDLKPLVAAFSKGESDVAKLLVAAPSQRLGGSGSTDQLAALVTIAWIEDVKGHDALVRLTDQLARGNSASGAIGSALGLNPRGVEVAVAKWTRRKAGIKDKPVRRPGAGGDERTPAELEEP